MQETEPDPVVTAKATTAAMQEMNLNQAIDSHMRGTYHSQLDAMSGAKSEDPWYRRWDRLNAADAIVTCDEAFSSEGFGANANEHLLRVIVCDVLLRHCKMLQRRSSSMQRTSVVAQRDTRPVFTGTPTLQSTPLAKNPVRPVASLSYKG